MPILLRKLGQILHRLRSGAIELSLRPYLRLLAKIDRFETDFRRFTDDRLRLAVAEVRENLARGNRADNCLPQLFAAVREVADRVLGLRPYDQQLIAGIVLHQGKVAQMQTGEGKTLAAVPPAVLNALTGQGVHVLTFNDYLAHRDANWMGPVFDFLGLSVGCVVQGMSSSERQAAYRCDVTYVTAKEAGFDFLRDQLVNCGEDLVHRPFHFAIIDEADSILIDEARVPLVIAGDIAVDPIDVGILARLVSPLERDVHFEIGDRARNVNFTAAGLDHLEHELDCGDLHNEDRLPLLTRLNQALHAEYLLRCDIDYIVRNGEVLLLDELTGRVAENRRWPYGLQEAVEAKEGQTIQSPGKILGSITIQHFVSLYEKLSGMTGTAEQAADELRSFYDFRVAVVPTHENCIRVDQPDQIFANRAAKFAAVVDCIGRLRQAGQPVLVGTANVQESDQLVERLRAASIPCQTLNAKNDHEEASVIAAAGTFRSVTISTNMAGRGTDIKLGGPEEQDRNRVKGLGGLFVIGTNRHESRRIDNQLRGRSGRQGDPGCSQFLISVEDDLLRRFGLADVLNNVTLNDGPGGIVEDREVPRKLAHIQRVVEGECFEIRRTLRKYSQVLDNQRKEIANRRRSILIGETTDFVLPQRSPQRYSQLAETLGQELLREVERQITLFQIDKCWSDHLEHMAEVRESIHLYSLGGLNPYFEYQKRASQAYRDLLARIDDEIVEKFNEAEITTEGLDLEREGLLGPAATWTYMITDHPVGDLFDRLARGVKRMFSKVG